MPALLPDDILRIICDQLWEHRDFDTLYRCTCSGKQLAVPALASIYRMHEVAPITSTRSDEIEEVTLGKTEQQSKNDILVKRVGMWRAIVLSSLSKTLFPYSKYIRTLRLQDLEDLLDLLGDPKLKTLRATFFKHELASVEVKKSVKMQKKDFLVVDATKTSNRLADIVTRDTPMLEELSGNVFHSTLSQCIPRLPKLQYLILYQGEALEATGNLLSLHCPLFKSLKFYGWQDPEADQQFATFLNDLRPNSLESFEIISTSQIGVASFLALNCHRESLSELKLVGIKAEAIPDIPMLRSCTNLVSLALAEDGVATQDLEKRHYDVFLETIAWLRECQKLRTISMAKMLSATALLTPVLLEHNINLTKLDLEGYSMSESQDFHRSLASQTNLQSLWLKGESSELGSDVDVLVEALSKLENMTDLRLREISDYFLDGHICKLAKHLPRLKIWWTSGYAITNAIWADVASLHALQDLSLSAITRFTAEGIMRYISSLGSGNKGLVLNVTMEDMDFPLSEEEQLTIRNAMSSKFGGRFDFMYFRDPEESSFDGESD